MVRCNVFIVSLVVAQVLIIVAYEQLATHEGYGNRQKLDEARQQQAGRHPRAPLCVLLHQVPDVSACLRPQTRRRHYGSQPQHRRNTSTDSQTCRLCST